MVSGSELPPDVRHWQFARATAGEKIANDCRVEYPAGPIEAAIVNGVLAQSDESDDNYKRRRRASGLRIVPAALAIGQTFGVGRHALLRARDRSATMSACGR